MIGMRDIVLLVLALLYGASISASASGQPAAFWSEALDRSVSDATSVRAIRIRDVLEGPDRLTMRAMMASPADRTALSADASEHLKQFVVNSANYRGNVDYAPSCGFVVAFAYEFERQGRPPAWWLVTNCGEAVLVSADMPVSTWSANARYLTQGAFEMLDRCNGYDRTFGGAPKQWHWPDPKSCLGP
jgi:hypothetical protein